MRVSMVKVSIAIATYNGETYLEEQLNSFLTQTRQPDEVVISDDCSTDGTLEIIRAFAAKASFDVVYSSNEKNLGFVESFNEALRRCTGDLVFLSDQDDVWFPEKIATMTELAKKTPHAMVLMNDAVLTDANLRGAGITRLDQLASLDLKASSFTTGCCIMIRRRFLDLVLPIPTESWTHDIWIVTLADMLDCRIIYRKPLQSYRRHDGNVSAGKAITFKKGRSVSRLIGQFHSLITAEHNLSPQIDRWVKRINALENLAGRWEPASEAQKIRDYIVERNLFVQALCRRNEIRQLHGVNRLFVGTRFLIDGGYAHFRGIRSLLKDLFFSSAIK